MPPTTTQQARMWWIGVLVVIALSAAIFAATRGEPVDRSLAVDDVDSTALTQPALTQPARTTSTSMWMTSTTGARPRPEAPDEPSETVESTAPPLTFDLDEWYERIEVDEDDPALGNRDLPSEPDEPPPTTVEPPPWASSTLTTPGGHLSTDVGCADSASISDLDEFFGTRVGPVLGWDYQHVYPLGGGRQLWLFQDTFIDHSGTATALPGATFVHNAALVQDGACFRLLHRGSADSPQPFEIGDGRSKTRSTWWWPMGGELAGGRLWVFWAEMVKDPYDPDPPNGLGWHPVRTYLASYDTVTLARTSFGLAPNSGTGPIYGYAVSSDAEYSYLFGNTFEQNMIREGGFWNPEHSATSMWLARVPKGRFGDDPEYRTAGGWSNRAADAVAIVDRFHVENPMQPRYLAGQWVSVTAVDGYWGDELVIDVADQPWGPWYTIHYGPLVPRGGDPKMNTYHAHLLPYGGGSNGLAISVSNNARDMRRDAWYAPHRYRPTFVWLPTAPTPTTTTTTTSTTTTTTTSTTLPETTTTTTSAPTSTSTTSSTTSTTTSTTTTVPETTTTTAGTTTSTSTSTTTTTLVPPG